MALCCKCGVQYFNYPLDELSIDICPFINGNSERIICYCISCSGVLWDLLQEIGYLDRWEPLNASNSEETST